MSNVFTLDSMREEADNEFAPMKVEVGADTVSLRSILRLNKKNRETVMGLLRDMNSEEKSGGLEDIDRIVGSIEKVIELVADNPKPLLKAADGDFAILKNILESWVEATQVGEAENSPTSSTDSASS